MMRIPFATTALLLALVTGAPAYPDEPPPSAAAVPADHADKAKQGTKLFREQVRGILTMRCLNCHGGRSVKGDFDLATREALLDSGFVNETAEDSYLVDLIEHRGEPAMPFQEPRLPQQEIDLIRRWIDLGSHYDKPLVEKQADPPGAMQVSDEDRQFWSFQPLKEVPLPPPDNADEDRHPVDRLANARLREAGLVHNGPASRRVLIRRAYFDLIGLPPTPEEVEDFVNDPDPLAWEKLIDRMLASDHYGERWARHWMDVARFAESHGYEQDYDRPHAYHYRDFLINAFNQDLPYDQFIRWQLAGDELAPDEPLALMATGFLGAGSFPTQLTEAEFESARYDELDDMVATTGVAFLGLSTGCARCHDHKFDPIPAADYYRLAATFATTIRSEIELDLEPEDNARRRRKYQQKLDELTRALKSIEEELVPKQFDTFLAQSPDESLSPWRALAGNLTSTAGTKYEQLPDGSWLATGPVPNAEDLVLEVPLSAITIRSLRLEALTHESLPHNGPGRADNGNFALGNISLGITPANSPGPKDQPAEQLVAFSAARATHQQNDSSLSVAASIDSNPVSGWAVDAGGIGHDQAAVFDLAEPVHGPGLLKVTLHLHHPNRKHTLGRLRLSVSGQDSLPPTVGDPGPAPQVAAALNTLRTSPHEKQARRIALEWYRTQVPQWQAASQALASHRQAGPGVVLTKVMVTSEGFPHMSHHADGRGYPHFYPDVYHLSRGDVHQKEEIARVGYLQVLMHDGATPSDWQQKPPDGWDRTSFSRASLAHWITDPDRGAGALAARVAVNRLWHHHFGTGIVPTPNDFGFSGERPTHPELLDWLARDFIENGWSLKRMHKLLMTSQLYQQSSELDPAKAAIDPENRLLWRWRPRRLEAEAIRDSILAVSGLLDRTMFGPGTLDEGMRRRSIYFFIKRSQLIPTMMLFDWPEHLVSIGRRSSTTIAPQALAFLNSPHFRQMAEAFAAQLNGLDDRTAINTAWKKALSRPPTEDEQALAVQFLDSQRESYVATGAKNPGALARVDLCTALFGMNEFLWLD